MSKKYLCKLCGGTSHRTQNHGHYQARERRRKKFRLPRYCACGCKKEIEIKDSHFNSGGRVPKYVTGHNFVVWMRKLPTGELSRRRRAVYDDPEYYARIVKKHNSKETIAKHRATGVAQWKDKDIRRRNLASIRSEDCSARKSASLRRTWAEWTEEERQARSQLLKQAWDSLSDAERSARIKASLVVAQKRPNVPERKLDKILRKNFPGEFKLNVRGEVVFGGLVPDFVNVNGRKLVVEHFGSYWHGLQATGRDKKEEEFQRKKHFAKWGFKTVIVWENELEDEVKVVEKMRRALR